MHKNSIYQYSMSSNKRLIHFSASSNFSYVLLLAWGQARFKFGVVMTSHLSLVSLAFFFCFQLNYALS